MLFAGRGGRGGRGGRLLSRLWYNRLRTGEVKTGSNLNYKKFICNWCRFVGYIEADCRKKMAGELRKVVLIEVYVIIRGRSSVINIIFAVYLVYIRSDDVSWFIDSGATVYICYFRNSFDEYEVFESGQFVFFGDESGLSIAGSGRVFIMLRDGFIRYFRGVFYVLQMSKNLMSVRYLCKDW